MKAQTLRETNLVFSGLVALGTRPEDSEYWKLATTFGATCSNQLSPKTTHLVANQPGTAKVHSAKRFPRVKVVYPQWLLDSVARWVRLEEGPYLLPTVEEQRPATTPPSPVRPELSDGESEAKTTAAVETAGNDAVDLDLADLDWGDAMKEVDDLLLETDDDDDLASLLNPAGGDDETTTDGESDTGGGSYVGVRSAASTGGGGGRKRPRVSSTPSSESVGSNAATSSATAAAESPLQKRVKTARSRRSGLKTSLSAAAAATAATAAAEGDASAQPSAPLPSESAQSPNGKNALKGDLAVAAAAVAADETAAADLSHASSSIGSDDEDLLAMAADLESGWS
jgi:RNA polymerase II subunit A-like phosphatase